MRLAWSFSGYMLMRQFTRLLVWWYFSGPLYLAVDCSTLPVPEEYIMWIILGDDFRMDAVFSSLRFVSGYKFTSVYEGFWSISPAAHVVDIRRSMCWLVLLVTIHLELCSSTLMSVAISQVSSGQGDILFGVFGQTAQKTVDFLQLLFIAGRRHPVMVKRPIPMVVCSVDKEIPQLQFLYEVIDAPVVHVVFLPAVAHDRCPWF